MTDNERDLLVKEAHALLDKIEFTLHFIVSSILANKGIKEHQK